MPEKCPLAFSYTNNNTGAFSWDNPNDPVGDLGAQSHNMTFTPSDAANYNTVTRSVKRKA